MSVARRRRVLGRVLLFFLALSLGGWAFAEWGTGLPAQIHLAVGRGLNFQVSWPITVSLVPSGREQPVLRVGNQARHALVARFSPTRARRLVLEPVRQGSARLAVRLFGVIPLRSREVTVLPEIWVVPGGEAIGVLMAAHGMVITGFSPVPVGDGRTEEPARRAGLKVGDLLTSVNGQPVHTAGQLGALVAQSRGRPVVVEVRRLGKKLRFLVRPARLSEGGSANSPARPQWRLGVYVEDPTAGVGTLSFWEPRTGVYGALGHMITDSLSHREVPLNDGRIVPAVIAGVQPGRRGRPGEKIGLFHHSQGVLGTIERNTACGIFGRIVRPPGSPSGRMIPVATREEVHPGPAEMLTVVEQQRVERFRVEILRVRRSSSPTSKGLVLRVDDRRLLSRTGGIVQGMSGSPIMQDGRLVGVVTHVLVNDPTRGYGVLAEWMAWECGLLTRSDQAKKGESRAS